MNPPQSVDILSHEFAIAMASDEALDGHLGDSNANLGLIRVRASSPPALQRDTTLHETLHMVVAVAGHQHYFRGNEEERLIRTLTPLILDTLRRNPALASYLLARDADGPRPPRTRPGRYRASAGEGSDRGLSRVSALPSKGSS